jgi:predicted anti-sigma-YlaC factor YlaD
MAMTCKELVELATEYLEGAMSPELRAAADAHLAECEGCTLVMSQFRETIRLTGKVPEEQVTEAQQEALRRVFRDFQARR